MDQILFWLVPAASVLALYFAWYFHCQMMKESEGTPQMIKIAAAVRKVLCLTSANNTRLWVGISGAGYPFLHYGIRFRSAELLGTGCFPYRRILFRTFRFLGMKTATYASARTANAARTSLNAGLRVAFRSGAVMGLVVVALACLIYLSGICC